MKFRKYNKETDKKSAFRIWLECGWVKDNKNDKKAFNLFVDNSNSQIVEVNGEAEALVVFNDGVMRYQNTDLKHTSVSGVTVSRLLRKQSAAPRLMGKMLMEAMEAGTHTAGLGMFEQGFYNRLGFGSMNYEHWYSFDPVRLKVYNKGGIPIRLTTKNWKEMYRCHKERMTGHGFVTLEPAEIFKAEVMNPNCFGLGFERDGKLSHYIWFYADSVSHGPYNVNFMCYKTWDEFLELMGILKSLEDQVHRINMKEPAHIQLQDFLEKPFHHMKTTKKGKYESNNEAEAYQQLRIMDVISCMEAVEYEGEPFSFNLTLTDPLVNFLEDKDFKGSAGDFTVTLGSGSVAARGHKKGLPLVSGSIGGFSRVWIGVLAAGTAGLTEDLTIAPELVKPLEAALYKPYARSNWDY